MKTLRSDAPSVDGPAGPEVLLRCRVVDEAHRCAATLPCSAHAMSPVRELVRRRLAEWAPAAGPASVEDAALLATELLTNAYLNAGPTARCRIELAVQGRVLRVSVDDPHPVLPTVRRLGLWDDGGRSVRVVAGLSVRWGAERLPHGRFAKRVWGDVALRAC